jgi:hypothetical protein
MRSEVAAACVAVLTFVAGTRSAEQPARTQDLQRASLAGGGEVTIRHDGDVIHVSVQGPRAGLASLCVGDASQVRILHASAALGEALYEKDGDRWLLKREFDWRLRDTPRTAGPTESQKQAFFTETGWVANASSAGSPAREFRIRLTQRTRYLGVTFLATAQPLAVSFWPATMDDDCRLEKIGQGFLPATARFRPERWEQLPRRE